MGIFSRPNRTPFALAAAIPSACLCLMFSRSILSLIHIFDVIINMLEQTDFCICDLSATPHAEKIQKYASQVKRTVLLDLSRTDAEVDKYRE